MGNQAAKDNLRREFEDLRKDLNQGSVPGVAAEYQECLNKMKNLPLNIAVTGDSAVGKSSFINAFRGVMDDDDDAAEVAATEGTKVPKPYPYPSFPKIKLWDLPGIRTPKFQAGEYLKKVQFKRYDFFVIITSDRLTENDALLAKEIKRMRKKFYYVRARIDESIKNKRRKRDFNEMKTLSAIRKYCEDGLKEAAEISERVFLISNHHVHMYDFPLLKETMASELPDHKKHILTPAVHVFSENKLMKKKELMKDFIKKVAWLSAVIGALPVPGLSMVWDVAILIDALKFFCQVFGLDDRSLRFLALQTGKEFKELRSAIKKTPLANTINEELVFSLLMKSSVWVTVSVVELALDVIPVVGSLFGGASSYLVTCHFLKSFLDDAVEDAQNVRAKLLE